jgi:adenosylcobinamide amidohydrolase
MRLHISIEGVNAEVDKNKLVILSKRPLKALSSAVLNGGLVKANGIISIHMTQTWLHSSSQPLGLMMMQKRV